MSKSANKDQSGGTNNSLEQSSPSSQNQNRLALIASALIVCLIAFFLSYDIFELRRTKGVVIPPTAPTSENKQTNIDTSSLSSPSGDTQPHTVVRNSHIQDLESRAKFNRLWKELSRVDQRNIGPSIHRNSSYFCKFRILETYLVNNRAMYDDRDHLFSFPNFCPMAEHDADLAEAMRRQHEEGNGHDDEDIGEHENEDDDDDDENDEDVGGEHAQNVEKKNSGDNAKKESVDNTVTFVRVHSTSTDTMHSTTDRCFATNHKKITVMKNKNFTFTRERHIWITSTPGSQ